MEHNMNFTDIGIRYLLMMVLVIIGGLFKSPLLMLVGFPFFLFAILGWCPIFHFIGINHYKQMKGEDNIV